MRNLLLFADGAVHAALWTAGPLLLPSLLHHDAGERGHRPLSAEEALSMAWTRRTLNNANGTVVAVAGLRDVAALSNEGEGAAVMMASTTGAMVWMLAAYLAGRAVGCHVMDRRRGIYPRLALLCRRLPCTTCLRDAPSWRMACMVASLLAPLLLLNWGLGIFTYGGWMAIRFVTALISGGMTTWGKEINGNGNGAGLKEKRDWSEGPASMEEGRALLSTGSDDELVSAPSTQRSLDKEWLDWHWLAGAATSSLLGGMILYPLNRLMPVLYPHERMYAFLLVVGLGGVVDRCLCRYYSARPSTPGPSFSDVGMVGDSNGSFRTPNNDRGPSFRRSSSTQRRKQVHPQWPMQSTFDDEQQITFYNQYADTPHRHRSGSHDTIESEQFFDCLDDIDLDSEHDVAASEAPLPSQNYHNQIAIYSGRKVAYPDGTPASVPAGESISTIPPGYLTLYKNDRTKAQSKYSATQEWRRDERIHSIHARPHTWYPKIKEAYPHVIHGFTPNGMPVVYESPGKMNLKELFRNGCRVEDMLFHYCYLMEYLSNLESILTELHSDDDDDGMGEWQDELAAYSYAKQSRLQKDPVAFGFCVVMDVSGASPSSLSGDVMVYLKRAGEINAAHYPGSMRRAIAAQAPFWIGVAWKAIKGVMPASVTVDLLSGAQTMEGGLKAYIDEDQIPVEYGGTSKFALGEHPFEVGLRKLVERQGESDDGVGSAREENCVEVSPSEDDSPLHHSAPLRFSPVPQPEHKNELMLASPASLTELSTMTREWDGLPRDSVLTVASILHFFAFVVVGSLELALPYWAITHPRSGGMGYEAQRSGAVVFLLCCIALWATRRPRYSQLTLSTIEKYPLRGFRIGIGTACFILLCISLIPLMSDPESMLGFLCLSGYLSLIFLAIGWALLSLEHLRGTVVRSSEDGNDSISTAQPSFGPTFGRVAGYVCVAPIYQWTIRKDLSFPLFLWLLACVCWLLYLVSFSLHTAAPSSLPTSHAKKKESQFISAMSSWLLFTKEMLVVASADITFLVRELSRRNPSKVSNR